MKTITCPLSKEECNKESYGTICGIAHFELGCFFPALLEEQDGILKQLGVIGQELKRIADYLYVNKPGT